jgi:hypothetical protein
VSHTAVSGARLAWQSASLDQLGLTPFFIEWSRDTSHPSTTSPSGCTFVKMTLEHPAPERLQVLFKTAHFVRRFWGEQPV